MTKKPIFVEVFAWNEPILALVALGWSAFIALYRADNTVMLNRELVASMVAVGGLALLSVQSAWFRTLVDYRLPLRLVRVVSQRWKWRVIRFLPASAMLRVVTHFCFVLWWTLMGVAITLTVNSLEDVRLVFYFGFALLHFDRLVRLVVWLRQ